MHDDGVLRDGRRAAGLIREREGLLAVSGEVWARPGRRAAVIDRLVESAVIGTTAVGRLVSSPGQPSGHRPPRPAENLSHNRGVRWGAGD
jgi:hypothetical protein